LTSVLQHATGVRRWVRPAMPVEPLRRAVAQGARPTFRGGAIPSASACPPSSPVVDPEGADERSGPADQAPGVFVTSRWRRRPAGAGCLRLVRLL